MEFVFEAAFGRHLLDGHFGFVKKHRRALDAYQTKRFEWRGADLMFEEMRKMARRYARRFCKVR
jgi:hypothetical protein